MGQSTARQDDSHCRPQSTTTQGASNLLQTLKSSFIDPWKYITAGDVSGSLGDLGTFLPLTVALVSSVGLDLGTTLIFSGVYNIYSGAAFGVPIPVQPMKSIAAVAITEDGITLSQTLLAGFLVSAVVLVLGVTRLIDLANRAVPESVIRGIQVGIGLKLAIRGFKLAAFSGPGNQWRQLTGPEGLFLTLVSAVYLLLTVVKQAAPPHDAHASSASETVTETLSRGMTTQGEGPEKQDDGGQTCSPEPNIQARHSTPHGDSGKDLTHHDRECSVSSVEVGLNTSVVASEAPPTQEARQSRAWGLAMRALRVAAAFPAALLVVLVGVCITVGFKPGALRSLRFGPSKPKVLRISTPDWQPAILRAALPQLPLTVLNSVVAVTMLSHELFPDVPVSMVHMSVSVGVMNAVGPWFGAMPCCHGAGGMAAQVRFGARSGAAPMLLGVAKTGAGLLFGSSLFELLRDFPEPLLGCMLVVSGAELACTASKLPPDKVQWLLMMLTATGCMAKDTGSGFLVGFLSSLAVRRWRLPWRRSHCDTSIA